jgi:hypothetical protein
MAKSITEVAVTNTFQNWLSKTNELVQLVNSDIVTASTLGDITVGDVILNGTMTANTVVAFDVLRASTISAKVGSSSIVIEDPINVSTNQVVLNRLTSALGPRASFYDNSVDWQIGFESPSSKNFVIATGGTTIFRVSSNGNVEISGSIIASSITSNSSTATKLSSSKIIAATGDISWNVNFDGASDVTNTATVSNNAVTNAKFRQSAGLSVVGRSASTAGNVDDMAAALDHQVIRRFGNTLGFGALQLSQAAAVTGQLGATNGGTGLSTLTQNKVLVGNGTGAVIVPDELHWDPINSRLGVGTSTPAQKIDVAGNVRAALFIGTATSANYADLAEKYLPDTEYTPGTVVMVGGEKEITATQSNEDFAIGVISENPAFMMNRDLEGGVYVALKGRVPVKTVDNVKKGDILVPGPNGHALKGTKMSFNRFAVALSSAENGYVEAVIL